MYEGFPVLQLLRAENPFVALSLEKLCFMTPLTHSGILSNLEVFYCKKFFLIGITTLLHFNLRKTLQF